VALNHRHIIHPADARGRRQRGYRRSGRDGRRFGAEDGRGIGIAKIGGFGSNNNLSACNWPKRDFLQRGSSAALTAGDPCLEPAARDEARPLSRLGRRP